MLISFGSCKLNVYQPTVEFPEKVEVANFHASGRPSFTAINLVLNRPVHSLKEDGVHQILSPDLDLAEDYLCCE